MVTFSIFKRQNPLCVCVGERDLIINVNGLGFLVKVLEILLTK